MNVSCSICSNIVLYLFQKRPLLLQFRSWRKDVKINDNIRPETLSWKLCVIKGKLMRFGYARVSTQDQKLDLQLDALRSHGILDKHIFVDVGSGRSFDRPQLCALLRAVRDGDELAVWRLDRIGRSTKDLISTVEDLNGRGVNFVSLHERIETASAAGRLMLGVFAAIASFERDLLVERTNAGLHAARARGRKGGRPPSLGPSELRLARSMLADQSVSVTEVARHFKVGRNTLYRSLKRET